MEEAPDLNLCKMVSSTSHDEINAATQNLSIHASRLVDIAIVGGGASGLAVAIQLLDRVKQGKIINSITMIEKRASVGPGLAYSEACTGSIVNMRKFNSIW